MNKTPAVEFVAEPTIAEPTIADYGKAIEKDVASLAANVAGYLALCTGEFGTPLEKRKQIAILKSYVVGNLPKAFMIKGAADMKRWLAGRPDCGLIVK